MSCLLATEIHRLNTRRKVVDCEPRSGSYWKVNSVAFIYLVTICIACISGDLLYLLPYDQNNRLESSSRKYLKDGGENVSCNEYEMNCLRSTYVADDLSANSSAKELLAAAATVS